MGTTMSTKFHIGNYCSAPTIDVEIITDETIHCECGGELVDANHSSYRLPDYQHRVTGDYDHRPTRKPRCHYCGAEDTLTHRQHAWHDSADCSRCGGSYGFALGD